MKKKKMFTAVLTAVLTFGMVFNVSAADKGSVVFKGEAEKFATHVSGDEFVGIRPGETKSMSLVLENGDQEELKFYMSAEILDNLAESGDKLAAYDFSISKNGEEFFKAVIGGESSYNISTGKQYLSEDNHILLDTLKKGGSDEISITLTLDGSSTRNSYQGTDGEIQLVFSVETPDNTPPTVVKKVINYVKGAANTVVKTVKTGDPLPIGILAAVALSLIVIIVMLVKRKKNKMEEE